jgi:cyclopropane fatty-acyl-phospholipid synthase-like methyltransferase
LNAILIFSAYIAQNITANPFQLFGYFIFIYLIIFICIEFLDIYIGFEIWDQTERTVNCYNWFEHYFDKEYDKIKFIDYSESIFFDNYDISANMATENKYDYIYKELELTPGQKLLDCGCGIGTWIEYCKKKGVDVVGITLSEEQAKVIRKKGIEVYVNDYRVLNEDFIGKFDAITILGSSEHICTSHGFHTRDERSYNTYFSLFNLIKKYLKPEKTCKLLFTSLVKSNEEYVLNDWLQGYVLERHYGGYYTSAEKISKAIKENGFEIISIKDHTKDYHWISVIEPSHFGHWWIKWHQDPIDKIIYILRGLLTDPFLIHHWLYYIRDTWMWQFGGYQRTPLTDEQVKNAKANLKYITFIKPKDETIK